MHTDFWYSFFYSYKQVCTAGREQIPFNIAPSSLPRRAFELEVVRSWPPREKLIKALCNLDLNHDRGLEADNSDRGDGARRSGEPQFFP